MDRKLEQAARWLREARKAIALTGAGVSTESGIPDFRSAGGLWSRYDPAEYATLGAFLRDPAKVWNMLAELDETLQAQPNAGHRALAQLEALGACSGIITQNVDGLHQAAGSRVVVEYHGSGRTLTCLACGGRFSASQVQAMPRRPGTRMPMPVPCAAPADARAAAPNEMEAGRRGRCVLKPDVVFFDEMIPAQAVEGSLALVEGADLMLVIGTSCEVYPAAGLPQQVRRQGGRVIEINLEPAGELAPDLLLQGRFSQLMPALAQAVQRLGA